MPDGAMQRELGAEHVSLPPKMARYCVTVAKRRLIKVRRSLHRANHAFIIIRVERIGQRRSGYNRQRCTQLRQQLATVYKRTESLRPHHDHLCQLIEADLLQPLHEG